jgi:uncharacterized protein (DUF488 family)
MMTKQLFTIGYEGASVEDFLATLKAVKVSIVVDVRDYPLSRKRGFSKNILAALLEEQGISYIHLRGLGDPKPGREAAKSGDYPMFRKIFNNHLKTAAACTDMARAIEVVSAKSACLLCYERKPDECHRSIVGSVIIEATGQKLQHLGVQSLPTRRMTATSSYLPIHAA